MISLSKILANGSLTETQIFLGWLLNTRELKIYLSDDKYKSWSRQIDTILLTKKSNHKELDSLIGRLNHTGLITPLSRHYLSHIRGLKEKSKFHNMVSVSNLIRQDLKLWNCFFETSKTRDQHKFYHLSLSDPCCSNRRMRNMIRYSSLQRHGYKLGDPNTPSTTSQHQLLGIPWSASCNLDARHRKLHHPKLLFPRQW